MQTGLGLSHYDTREEVERQLKFQAGSDTSDDSWTKGPPEPDWDEAGFPELAEEALLKAQLKSDESVTKEYQRPRRIKAGELEEQQQRIDNAANTGNAIAVGTVLGVAA